MSGSDHNLYFIISTSNQNSFLPRNQLSNLTKVCQILIHIYRHKNQFQIPTQKLPNVLNATTSQHLVNHIVVKRLSTQVEACPTLFQFCHLSSKNHKVKFILKTPLKNGPYWVGWTIAHPDFGRLKPLQKKKGQKNLGYPTKKAVL